MRALFVTAVLLTVTAAVVPPSEIATATAVSDSLKRNGAVRPGAWTSARFAKKR